MNEVFKAALAQWILNEYGPKLIELLNEAPSEESQEIAGHIRTYIEA